MRYASFISYNFADKRWATQLHRWLEGYRVPKHLRGREGAIGTIGARLPPVFRDRDELGASSDLAQAVRDALDQSASLVVICSPASARSRWVNEEIRYFTATGRRHRIQCLIVDGEPHAADPERECLPPALLEDGASEPLAADARPHQDGLANARLKLIAGILGVPYDELRQREQQRRMQRLAWLAAGSTTGLLIAVGLTIAAVVARKEADRQRDEAERQRKIAVQRTLTAERTTGFVKSLFLVSDPSEARGKAISAREIVDRGAVQVRTQLVDEPAVRADLAVTVGQVYAALGLYREAKDLIDWSFSLPRRPADVTARQLLALGDVERNLGRPRDAVATYRRALPFARSLPAGNNAVLSPILAGLGAALKETGDTAGAAAVIKQALQFDRVRGGEMTADVARDYEELGQNHLAANDLTEAERLIQRALAIRLKLEGPLSPSVSDNIDVLGNIAYQRGDLANAERLLRSRVAVDERVLGAAHPDLATTLNNLARVMIERREFAAALPLLDRAVRINVKQRGWTHPDMAFFFDNRALALRALGRGDAAASDFARAWTAAAQNGHRNRAPVLADFALLKCEQGRFGEGLSLLDQARPLMVKTYPDDPWRVAWVDSVRAACLARSGKRGEAASLLAGAAEAVAKRWPPGTYYRAEFAAMAGSIRR